MMRLIGNPIMLRWSLRLLIVWILLCASSCASVLGAVATGGVDFIKSREASGAPSDELLTVKVKAELAQKDIAHMFSLISVNVETGRVMLTGMVPNKEVGDEAVIVAQGVSGVIQVVNELNISNAPTAAAASAPVAGSCNNDQVITNEILNQLLLNREIDAVNYSVDTLNGVVYIIGTAKTPQELEAVLNIANSIKDVKRVINHVLLATEMPPAQQTTTPQMQQVQAAVPAVAAAAPAQPVAGTGLPASTAPVAAPVAPAPVATTPAAPVVAVPAVPVAPAVVAPAAAVPVVPAAKPAPAVSPAPAAKPQPVAPKAASTLDGELADQAKAKAAAATKPAPVPAAAPAGNLAEELKTMQLNKAQTPAKPAAAPAPKPATAPVTPAPADKPATVPTATDATASETKTSTTDSAK